MRRLSGQFHAALQYQDESTEKPLTTRDCTDTCAVAITNAWNRLANSRHFFKVSSVSQNTALLRPDYLMSAGGARSVRFCSRFLLLSEKQEQRGNECNIKFPPRT